MKKNTDLEKFLIMKELILENLAGLRTTLVKCTDNGYDDIDDMLYNEILDLIDHTNTVDSSADLSEIIIKAKVIEENIDNWLAQKGISTMGLKWPQIK